LQGFFQIFGCRWWLKRGQVVVKCVVNVVSKHHISEAEKMRHISQLYFLSGRAGGFFTGGSAVPAKARIV
jgi:hypothetical protein